MMTLPPYELPRASRSAFLDPYRGCGARNARGPLPPSKLDYEALLQPYYGKTYRHKFTGQVRRVGGQSCPDGYVAMFNSTMGCWRLARKALDWLRNAEEV